MHRFGKLERRILFLGSVAAIAAAFFFVFGTHRGNASAAASVLANRSPYFEENKGQFDPRVRFRAHGTPFDLWLTATDAVYVVPDPSGRTTLATAVYMRLDGANRTSESVGSDTRATRFNYIRNDQPDLWRTDVPTYGSFRTADVYPGVDVVWHANDSSDVQYDFVVAPNADSSRIEWHVDGAKDVTIGADGDLLIATDFGPIRQSRPLTYQETDGYRTEVESSFEIRKGGRIGFRLGEYDRSRPVIIDPSVNLSILASSTFLGSVSNDVAQDIAVDSAGNTYTTGYTLSALFPTSPGTFDTTQNANDDIFVTKMNPAGTEVIFSTFIGGSGTDQARGILTDASNNIYLAGYTTSTNYPTTAGAYDITQNGSADVVLTKLNPTGTSLVFSTYLGGSTFEEAYDLARDTTGNIYVTGRTNGGTFPTTAGAVDTSFNGVADVFVAKFDQTGATLVYSTYLGGDANDYGVAIAVDSGGNAYVTGFTADGTVTDFPTTAGAFQTTFQGGTNDIFVSKLNSSGSALSYSTFIGGTDSDSANDIAIDATGNAYIVGNVLNGGGFPTTVGAYDTTQNGAIDIAVCKLNPTGSALVFSTYLGGSGSDVSSSIAIDQTGSVYVAGFTINSAINYPTTAGAFQTAHNGGHDGFLTRLSPTGSTLLYSTLIGGSSDDDLNGLALDPSGNVYVVGLSNTNATAAFPTTPEAYQNFYGGGQDVFISKFGDHAIFGRTVDTTGSPLANTAIALSGSRSGFMLTDAQGYFGFTDTQFGGAFTTSATNILYNFTPNTFTVAPLVGNTELSFVGRPTTSGPTLAFADVAGEVRSVVGDTPLGGTTVTLIDTVNPANSRMVTTNAEGSFSFNNIRAGSFYILIPERPGFNFDPGYYELALMDDQTQLEFNAIPNSPRPVQDFDGDGRTDLAVFRPAEGNWYILNSQDGSFRVVHFGLPGDVPLAADYDGDRLADLAVFRPSEGNWYSLMTTRGFGSTHFGLEGDKPVPADFDGDGLTDLAVFRPSTGVWHRLNSSDGGYVSEQFGLSSDTPLAGDFDGDGKSDIAIYRDGIWYRRLSGSGAVAIDQFGLADDRPLSGDFDGDGRTDIAVFRPSSGVWYWIGSIGGSFAAKQFGISGDVPVPADFDGDGRYDPAVYRSGLWHVMRIDGTDSVAAFGLASDLPIPSGPDR